MNITSRLGLKTETHPNKPAFIIFSPCSKRWDTVTFIILSDSIHRLTRGLQASRSETGLRTALMTPPSADLCAYAFAPLKLGIVPIMGDPAIRLKNASACLKAKIKDSDEIVHRTGDTEYFDEQGRLWYCAHKSHRVFIDELL